MKKNQPAFRLALTLSSALLCLAAGPCKKGDSGSESGSSASSTTTTTTTTTTPAALTASSGTQLLLHFDEGTGATSVDASGYNRTASMPNTGAWSTGYFSNAMQVNSTEFATVANTAGLDITGDMTIQLWIYPTMSSMIMTGADPGMGLISKRNTNTQQPYTLMIRSGGIIAFEAHYTGVSGWRAVGTDSGYVQLNQWQQIAATRSVVANKVTIKIFYNGSKVKEYTHATEDWGASTGNSHNVEISRDPYLASFTNEGTFKGKMDELRIMNVALSEAQILSDYQSQAH